MKHFKILFNPEGGEGSGGGQAGAGSGQDGAGGGSNGDGGGQPDKTAERISYLEQELTKVINEKKDLKGKLDEKDNADLTSKEKWQELLEKKGTEIGDLQKQIEELSPFKEDYEKLRTEREAEIKAQRDELIAELPTDEHKGIAEAIGDLSKLRAYVKLNAKKDPTDTDGGSPGANAKLTPSQLADMEAKGIKDEAVYKHYLETKEKLKPQTT